MVPVFVSTEKVNNAVNAALHLRRPLLLTGPPGSGKSTLVDLIASELQLGVVLRWHVTSKSTLEDGLFDYDALGRLNASQLDEGRTPNSAESFVTLGPLGTALADEKHPRAVLIDEIDKSDLDLPGDLLDVLERGEFSLPPLIRDSMQTIPDWQMHSSLLSGDQVGATDSEVTPASPPHHVRGADGGTYRVDGGVVRAHHLPVIVLTSNGERSFPPPFLRRCIRISIESPNVDELTEIVARHFTVGVADAERSEIETFVARALDGEVLAVDQLLNLLHLVAGGDLIEADVRAELRDILLRGLAS